MKEVIAVLALLLNISALVNFSFMCYSIVYGNSDRFFFSLAGTMFSVILFLSCIIAYAAIKEVNK